MNAMQTHAPSKTAPFAHPRRNVAALGIEPGMLVADFGSGSGAYVLAIADRLEGLGHIYAIDIQRDLLRRISNEATKLGHKNVEVIWADLEAPRASKPANGTLDLVLASNILFQVPDKKALLSEARRILKAKGRLVIVDWSASTRAGRDGSDPEGQQAAYRAGSFGPQAEDIVSKEKALELVRKEGFELVKEFPAGAHHYGLILRSAMAQ